jgi:predicted nucleic acid-binding protein
MSRIFWDTMLFVYWLEDHAQYGPRVRTIFDRMRQRNDELCTSALAVGETLVAPCKRGANDVVEYMERFLASGVEVLPFTGSTAVHFAKIRARYTIDPADAINLACAADARTDLFITNDASLVGKSVAGIQFIVDLNTNLF